MSAHRWGRSQKYHARHRHLYALLFPTGHAYIGQTVNLTAREKQHRRPAGGWGGRSFTCVHLGTINGTEQQACEYEHAWRYKASSKGWRIYAKPPGIVVDPRRQLTTRHHQIAKTLQWPELKTAHRTWGLVKWIKAAIAIAALAALAYAML